MKVNATKDRMLTDIYEISTPKLCKNKRKKKLALKCGAKVNVLFFSPSKYTHFQKKAAIFSHLKIYMPCTNLNETKLTMLTSFVVDFDYFVKKI